MEDWKDIPGHPNYQVSNLGNVRLCKPVRQWDSNGYKIVNLSHPTKKGPTTVRVHRAVAAAFLGDSDLCVLHENDNPMDNRLANLRYGTVRDNTMDSIRNGTAVCIRRGDRHPASKNYRGRRQHVAEGRTQQD
jgi:hypothetical protein